MRVESEGLRDRGTCKMTHILIKWVGEDKWDVYPVKALDNPAIGVQLMSDEGAIKKLRRQVVDVRWKVDEDPSPATLLDFGKCC